MMQLALTFNDIFKSSFLEQIDSFAPLDMVIDLCAGTVYPADLPENVQRRDVFRELRSFPDGSYADYHSCHYGRHIKRRPFAWYGRRAVHCPLPCRHQGADGHCLPLLGNRRGDCSRCRLAAAGGIRIAVYRRNSACFCQPPQRLYAVSFPISQANLSKAKAGCPICSVGL